jgi:hypothetical protein
MKEKDKKSSGKPGALKGAHIEVASNGYKLNLHHAADDSFPGYPGSQPGTVHKGRKDLLSHLDGVLAKHEGSQGIQGPRPSPGTNLLKGPPK